MIYFNLLDAYSGSADGEDYDYVDGEHEEVVKAIIKASRSKTNITFNGFLKDFTIELLKDEGFTVVRNNYSGSIGIYWNS